MIIAASFAKRCRFIQPRWQRELIEIGEQRPALQP